jgi:hypothetical protein
MNMIGIKPLPQKVVTQPDPTIGGPGQAWMNPPAAEKQEMPAGARYRYSSPSGAVYYTRVLPDGREVPENVDLMHAAIEQDKLWEQQNYKSQQEQQASKDMQENADKIARYSRGVSMIKTAQDNPDFDYLNAPTDEINKVAGGQELLKQYGNKMAYAADQGLLDTKNPYSQKIFESAVDELNPTGSKGSGLAMLRKNADTPENRRDALSFIEQKKKDGNYDDATAQSMINLVNAGNVYDANLAMGRAQLAGVSSYERKKGGYKAAEETQDRPLAGMTYKDVLTLKKTVTDKINALDRPKSTAVGMAGNNNIRADRATDILNDPGSTAADIALATADLLYIMQGGAPLAEQVKTGVEKSAGADWQNWLSYVTSNPKEFDNPAVRGRLKKVIDGIKQVDNKVISDNIGIEAATFKDLINKYPDWWSEVTNAVLKTTATGNEAPAVAHGITTAKPKKTAAATGETKIIKGVTYKKGVDGLWHKQK